MKQLMVVERLNAASVCLRAASDLAISGRVHAVAGLGVSVSGLDALLAIGDRLTLVGRGEAVPAEITAFRAGAAQAMPLGPLTGIGPGARADLSIPFHRSSVQAGLHVSDGWLGRVIDPLGNPLDQKGVLPPGPLRPVRAAPPPAAQRSRLGACIGLGVKALDLFTTCRSGQRLGLFAGSGVGKSTLLSMLAQQAACDVVVLALVGERGREVREFLEDDLGPSLARSVVIVATSDQPALVRREAAYAAMTVAEHFRDQGRSVLLMMDSVTRFCLALREIGLASGEPPATRGYPPSVFAELPGLLERAGPGVGIGSITGLFTVLVDGDDHNEPVADAVRGILDGHVVLDRRIAESGRYPAIDVLRSLSRTVPGCLDPQQHAAVRDTRAIFALHAELADLVRLGAYKAGTDPAADRALRLAPQIEALLNQGKGDHSTLSDAFSALQLILTEASNG